MNYNKYRAKLKADKTVNDKAKMLLSSAKSRAKKHKIDFNLDLNWVNNNLMSMTCQFTYIPLTLNNSNTTYNPVKYNSPSIHRMIPELGYTKANCIIIANSVNMFISNHSIDDIIKVGQYFTNSTENILLNYKTIKNGI